MFPESWRNNPVLDLWENALEDKGIEFVKVGSDYVTFNWLLRERKKVDVLHFHWIEYHYTRPSLIFSWLNLIKFLVKLITARLLGYRLVWTVHNLLPHEQRQALLDRTAGYLVCQVVNSVMVMCEEGRKQVNHFFHRYKQVFTGYLGNYISVYPDTLSRKEARAILNLPDQQMVFLFFGSIRRYKGVEELIKCYQSLQVEKTCLLICGKPIDDTYKQTIESLARADSRIITKIDWIDNQEVQVYFKAADVAVLPFNNILTSSSIMLAHSFSLPVVTPAIGCSPEIITEETGFLYDPASTGELKEKMLLCITKRQDLPAMGRLAFKRMQEFTWERLANITCQAYGIN